jgi:hypothetical protein
MERRTMIRLSWTLCLLVLLLSCPVERMVQAEARTIARHELQHQQQVHVHVNEHALLQITVEIHSLGTEEDLQILLLHTKNHTRNHIVWTVLVEPVVSGSTMINDSNHQNHRGRILERNVTEWMLDKNNNMSTAKSQLLFWMSLQPSEMTTETPTTTATTPTVPHLVSLFRQDDSSTTNNHKRSLQTRRLVQVPTKSSNKKHSSSSSSSPVLSVHLTASLASSTQCLDTNVVSSSFSLGTTMLAKTTMTLDPSRDDVTTSTTTSTDDLMWTLIDILLSCCMSSFGIHYLLEWKPHGVRQRLRLRLRFLQSAAHDHRRNENGNGNVVGNRHHDDSSQSCESNGEEKEEEHGENYDDESGQQSPRRTSQGQSPATSCQGQSPTSESNVEPPSSSNEHQGENESVDNDPFDSTQYEYRESPSFGSSSSSSNRNRSSNSSDASQHHNNHGDILQDVAHQQDESDPLSHQFPSPLYQQDGNQDERGPYPPPPPSAIREASPIQKHSPWNHPSCESSSSSSSSSSPETVPPQGRQAHDPDVTAVVTNDRSPNHEPTATTNALLNTTTIGTVVVGSQTMKDINNHGNRPENQKEEAIMDVSLPPWTPVETKPFVRTNQEPTSCLREDQANSIAKSANRNPANNNTFAEPSPLVSNVLDYLENNNVNGEDMFNGVIEILDHNNGNTQESYPQRQSEVLTQYSDMQYYSQNNILATRHENKDEEPSLLFNHNSPYGFHASKYDRYKYSPPSGPGLSPLLSNKINSNDESILTQRRQIETQAVDQSVGIDGHSNTPLESDYVPTTSTLQGLEVDQPSVSQSEKDQVRVSKHTYDNGLGSTTVDAKKYPGSQTAKDGDTSSANMNAGDTQAIDLQPKEETRMLEYTGTSSIASKIDAQERHPASSASAFKSPLDRNVSEGSPYLEASPPANSHSSYPSKLHPMQKKLKKFHAPREMNAPLNTTKICPPGQSDPTSIPPSMLPSKDSNRADNELGRAIADDASVSESYVSTLPPDSDCSSAGSVENLDFTSDNQDSSERKAVSSKHSHSTVASKNEAPKSRRLRRIQMKSSTKKHNVLKRNDGNSEKASDLGGSSQQRDSIGMRSAKRQPLQDRLNAQTRSSVALSTRSNTPSGTRRKCRIKPTARKRPRDTPEPELPAFGNDSDSVEILGFSLPTSSKKPRPFSKSSIVPDWVPSTGLQSISQQFQDDIPWNIIAVKPLSNPKEVPIKSIVLPYSNIANKDAA